MGDKNPIRTLGDYSKPSHEGYRNTIELPEGKNVVPLRSDTIRLVQNGCSFHEIRFGDPNQHLKDFIVLVDSLDLNGDNRERTRMRLFKFSLRDQASNWLERLPAGSISTWEDLTTLNKISSSCEICSGPHDTQYCMENPEQAFVEYASARYNEVGGKKFTTNLGPRNFKEAINAWKDKPKFNWERTQSFSSTQKGLFSTYSSSYQAKLERTISEFDSHQERRLSSLGAQLGHNTHTL
ncbi:hypothetical protein Tco_1056030 [Tanacetum coccineum]|uniref:MAK10-like protein n=1 Tax=Tanacetum coccineum TaxID=301880 RepID=A0ABQ5H1C3_9ASTR